MPTLTKTPCTVEFVDTTQFDYAIGYIWQLRDLFEVHEFEPGSLENYVEILTHMYVCEDKSEVNVENILNSLSNVILNLWTAWRCEHERIIENTKPD